MVGVVGSSPIEPTNELTQSAVAEKPPRFIFGL